MHKFASKQLVSKWSLSISPDVGLPFGVGIAERIKKKKDWNVLLLCYLTRNLC